MAATPEPPQATPATRRRVVAGGVAALIVAAVIVAALVSAGGGGDSKGTGDGGHAPVTAAKKSGKPAKPASKPLDKPALIAQADAICETSQSTYKGVYSREFEEVPDVEYATTLAGISRRGVERVRRLEPKAPRSVEPAFARYVRAQERVMRYDRQALAAAEAGDASAYLAARRRRDAEEPERYDLAREIGLEQCSLQPSS